MTTKVQVEDAINGKIQTNTLVKDLTDRGLNLYSSLLVVYSGNKP